MQRPALVKSDLQHVCIFCAARHRIAASVARPLSRRRSFQSGHALSRPPNITVAQNEDDRKMKIRKIPTTWGDDRKIRKIPTTWGDSAQVAGGLGRSAFTNQLTAKELKIRKLQRRYIPQDQWLYMRKVERSQFAGRGIGQHGDSAQVAGGLGRSAFTKQLTAKELKIREIQRTKWGNGQFGSSVFTKQLTVEEHMIRKLQRKRYKIQDQGLHTRKFSQFAGRGIGQLGDSAQVAGGLGRSALTNQLTALTAEEFKIREAQRRRYILQDKGVYTRKVVQLGKATQVTGKLSTNQSTAKKLKIQEAQRGRWGIGQLRDSAQVAGGLGRSAFTNQLTAEELKIREAQRARSQLQDQGLQTRKVLSSQFACEGIGQIEQRNSNPLGARKSVRRTAQVKRKVVSSQFAGRGIRQIEQRNSNPLGAWKSVQRTAREKRKVLSSQFAGRGIRQIGQRNFNPPGAWKSVQRTAQDNKFDALVSSSRTAQAEANLRRTPFHPWPDSTDAGTDRSNIAQGWKHVRRSIRETETDVVNPRNLDRGSGSENTRNHGLVAERIRVRWGEWRARLEQTKDGNFVELGTAVQQNGSTGLGSHGKIRFVFDSQETASPPNRFANASNGLERRNASRSPRTLYPFDEGRKRREFEISRNRNTFLAQNSKENSIGAIKTTSPDDIPAKGFRSSHQSRKSKGHYSSSPYVGGTLAHRNARLDRQFVREKVVYEKNFDFEEKGQTQLKRKRIGRKQSGPPKQIYLPEFITVSNLATVLKVRVEDFGSRLRALGFEATNNDLILDAETAGLIAMEFNYEPFVDTSGSYDLVARPPAIDVSLLPARPPVVTIMGHVDHGKTTLLDWLRKSSVAASEHGGITQHIGAFSVSMPRGRLITFLDTPGHAAFLSMRQRGANVTDIVILVVAADDSVKPQTIEAIKHAQAAKVPIIVAVSKIDKEEANVERVKHDLARYGVEIEDFGGDTQVVCISGKTGQGMAELEDAAIALADILDMRAETDGQAEGRVLESTRNQGGRIATVLVRRGTITRGDVLVAGLTWAKVRSLRNEAGAQVTAATPGTPVQIDGWKDQPAAGDEVLQAPDEKTAKSVVERRDEVQKTSQMAVDMEAVNEARKLEQEKRELEKRKIREAEAAAAGGVEIVTSASEASAPKLSQPGVKEIYFSIKADVSGSVEAVLNSVSALGNSEICAHVLRSGVGPVTEFDIEHAATAKSHIICFNTTVEPKVAHMAEAAGVKIMDHRVIYNLVDDVKAKLSEQLPSIVTQKVLGEAEVAQIFEITAKNNVTMPVAGCKVRNGVVSRNKKVRVLRERELIYDGTMSTLKNVKKNVMEMRKDSDCGMSFEDWTDFRIGDQVQSYEEIVQARSL